MKTKKIKMMITEDEFKLICDARNGNISDFTEPHFKKQFISGIADSISCRLLNNKWSVDTRTLILRLLNMSSTEILELQQAVDDFWEITERDYERVGYKSPEYLLKNLYHEPFSSN